MQVDVLYLHNAAETQLGEVGEEELLRRLHEAFLWLEHARADGSIRAYGMATWDCFRQACQLRWPTDARDRWQDVCSVGGGIWAAPWVPPCALEMLRPYAASVLAGSAPARQAGYGLTAARGHGHALHYLHCKLWLLLSAGSAARPGQCGQRVDGDAAC